MIEDSLWSKLGLVIATALEPHFTSINTLSNELRSQSISKRQRNYLRLTTALALAASVGLAMLLPHINYALFKDYVRKCCP